MTSSSGESESEPLIPRIHGFTSTVLVTTDLAQSNEMSNNVPPTFAPDDAISKQVNRKMDIALLPFLSLLYLLNGLDRSNVGNAETQGTPEPRMNVPNCSSQAMCRLYDGYRCYPGRP